jgi:hypothetical protein
VSHTNLHGDIVSSSMLNEKKITSQGSYHGYEHAITPFCMLALLW